MIKEEKTQYLKYTYILFLVFFIAVSYLAYQNYKDHKESHAEQFNESQLLIVQYIAKGVSDFVNSKKNDVETLSKSISFHDGSLKEIMRETLSFYSSKSNEMSTVRICDKDGRLIFALPTKDYKDKLDKIYTYAPFFGYVKDKNKSFISNVHVDETGERVITISSPIYSLVENSTKSVKDKIFNGVAAATIKLESIEELFADTIKMDERRLLWAIDNKGEIIIHSKIDELIGRGADKEFSEKEHPELNKITLSMLAQEEGTGEYEHNGVREYAAYAPAVIDNGNFWSIAIATPVYFVQKDNETNFIFNMIFAALLVLLFIALNLIVNKVYNKLMQIKFERILNKKKKQAERRYNELFENTENIIFIVNRDEYMIESFNKRFEKEVGLDKKELIGKSILDFLDDENQKTFVSNFKNTLKGINSNYELSIKNAKTYDEKVFSITNALIVEDDVTNDVQCIGIDMTSKKELSNELIETKNKLQSVFDGIQAGISLISKNFDIVMANKFEAKLFNKTPEEIIGKKCYAVFRHSMSPCSDCPALPMLEDKLPSKTLMSKKIKPGKERYYNMFTYPVYNKNNEFSGFISSVQDITDVKFLESEVISKDQELKIFNTISQTLIEKADLETILKNTLEKLIKFLKFSKGLVFLTDKETRKIVLKANIDVNKSFINKLIDLWGTEDIINEFIKNKSSIIIEKVSEDDRISFDLKMLFENENVKIFTLIPIKVQEKIIGNIVLFDEKKRIHKDQSTWLLDAIGNKIGILVENSQLRERLKLSAKELAKVQKIAIEKERLEAANELAGVTTHELNQPLTTIMSFAEFLMLETPEDSNTYQTLKVISEEASRMLSMVKKISSITKYETRKYISDTKIINIEKISKKDKS